MTKLMQEQPNELDPARLPWPGDGLESVICCPVCSDGNRNLLHEGLSDYAFFCAPGRWNLYICYGCGSNYLDPRPTPDSLYLAYADYYTHALDNTAAVVGQLSVLAKVRRALGNGYRNWRYGDDLQPESRLGILTAYLMPGWRQQVDRLYRHLPRYRSGERLLDVGCGNGGFLKKAQAIGWDVQGIDPDPNAVAAARELGIDIAHGGLEVFDGQSELFDVVTLSHVIEHVHGPEDMLRDIYRLLKPGGRIWIDTPNAEAYGHRVFGPHWRGLEPPRHLTIFTWYALERLLAKVGFGTIKRHVCTNNYEWLARASNDIGRAVKGSELTPSRIKLLRQRIAASMISNVNYRHSEFITLDARKEKTRI